MSLAPAHLNQTRGILALSTIRIACSGSTPFWEHYGAVDSHPILQRMLNMDFAVSCSIDPKTAAGLW
jgi:hypothetical protein